MTLGIGQHLIFTATLSRRHCCDSYFLGVGAGGVLIKGKLRNIPDMYLYVTIQITSKNTYENKSKNEVSPI